MGALSLDAICNSATYFSGKWSPELRRNQSRDVLRTVLSKLYGASHGSLFHARMRCSHAALAGACGLSREWTCKLVARLRAAGWVDTHAPRLAEGKQQEVSTFRPGRMLKRLLVMLLRSRQRSGRVNDCSQKLPNKEDIEKGRQFLSELRSMLTRKLTHPNRE
jgi:hypothetical protein